MMTNKEIAEKLLETLYQKMWFRGPLPEEGWAIEQICLALLEAQRQQVEAVSRAIDFLVEE